MFVSFRLPVLENIDDNTVEDNVNNANMLTRFPRWFVLSHVESQQCLLAVTLLESAKSKFSLICIILFQHKSHLTNRYYEFSLGFAHFYNSS